MKVITTLTILIFLFSLESVAQKEAYNWHFGNHAALNFSSGEAVPVPGSDINAGNGCTSLSDSAGNLLFYSNGEKIWNRNNELMPDGNGLSGSWLADQCALAVPDPASSNLYYLFTTYGLSMSTGCYYSVIDMNADNGLGNIVPGKKNIFVPGSDSAIQVMMAVAHVNHKAYWIIIKSFTEVNEYKAYLLDKNGLNPVPVISPSLIDEPIGMAGGAIKISPDGRFLLRCNNSVSVTTPRTTELYHFNNASGVLAPIFIFTADPDIYLINSTGGEFSANSEYLYLSTVETTQTPPYNSISKVMQLDMSKINDRTQFEQSGVILYSEVLGFWDHAFGSMLLGPNGKIYIIQDPGEINHKYLAGIANPALYGYACNFQKNMVHLDYGNSHNGLPAFVASFMVNFDWKGQCLGDTTKFTSMFLPVPDSIQWDFGDPASGTLNAGSDFHPDHYYALPGIYTVHAQAFYTDGTIKNYTRNVVITANPNFDFGPDKFKCPGSQVSLQSGVMLVKYEWSTGETTASISIKDPDVYWLTVENNNGCVASDTIRIFDFEAPQLVDTLVSISPTTCGNATGAIRYLQIEGGDQPVAVHWIDQWGNTLSDILDINGLAVGKYYLTTTYGSGCLDTLASYTIVNIDSKLIIEDVDTKDAHCLQPSGTMDIKVKEGLSDMLLYSVDGINYFANEGHFEGLPQGDYIVMVKDSEGCEAVFVDNPVTIGNVDGPVITSIIITPETPPGFNGSIEISGTGAGALTYYLDGTLQDTSFFEGLTEGQYHLTIMDEFGCQADTLIELPYIEGNYLNAIAAGDRKCLRAIASSEIRVSHVNGLKYLKATLNYDGSRLVCTHFNGSLPGIIGKVYPSYEKVVLEWQGITSITSTDTISLGELIFETLQSGLADIYWQSPPGTVFTDENGNTIHPELYPGIIEVHPVPEVALSADNVLCEGDSINLVPVISGGTDPLSLRWDTPQGIITSEKIAIPGATTGDAGKYTFIISDYFNCADSAEINLTVIEHPAINFPPEPIPFEQEYRLEAPQSYASYQWSTGDSIYYITVTEEGEYSVIIQTEEGCESRDTAMMVNVAVPIQVPNAFTPNGDGLNDTFKPIITKPDLVVQYHFTIFNRWGECFFETSDPAEGWDGKDEMAGVYNWVVSYSNKMGKNYQLRGVVSLIK